MLLTLIALRFLAEPVISMMSSNVLQRVLHIKYGGSSGSAVSIDRDGRQYLVTARHVVAGYSGGSLEIFHEKQWKQIPCDLVGHATGDVDISVLAPRQQLTQTWPLETGLKESVVGQQVYFLGFPYSMRMDVPSAINSDFPLPLVKGAVLSGLEFAGDKKLWLDGHNNPGFSGGPVVFVPFGRTFDAANPFRLAGIVSGYPSPAEPVVDGTGVPLPDHFYRSNPGIILAFDIAWAIELINANPVGYRL